jgi:hypothetical protein
MSIVQRIARMKTDSELQTRAGEFLQIARALAMAGPQGGLTHAARLAQSNNSSIRVQSILKSAVDAGSTSSLSQLVDYRLVAAGFLETLARASVFEAIRVAGGWRVVPLNVRTGAVSLGLAASQVGEMESKPISSLSISDGGVLPVVKAAAITVLTSELVRFSGSVGQELMAAELRTALGIQVDLTVFDLLLASGTPNQASSGSSATNAYTDLDFLLGAVTLSAQSRLFFVGK